MAAQTRVFRNDGKQNLNVVGLGELAPGEQLSVTSEFPPPVVLENYPGLVEVTDEEVNPTVKPPKKKGKS